MQKRKSGSKRHTTPPTPGSVKVDGILAMDIIDDKKSEAREDGLEVDPIPGSPIIPSPKRSPSPTLEPPRPIVGPETAEVAAKLARVNDRIVRLQEQYGKMKASAAILALRRKREARMAMEQLASPVDSTAMDETADDAADDRQGSLYDESLLRAQLTAAIEDVPDFTTTADSEHSEHSSPDPLNRGESEAYEYAQEGEATLPKPVNTLVSPAATPELESDSSHLDRQDSATASSVCANSSNTTSSNTSVEEELPTTKASPPSHRSGTQKPSQRLPEKNRGGNKLRWSIGDTTTTSSKSPRLSEHRHSKNRAEGGIYMGRMEGESKQSRRRRIRREKQVLQTMGTVVPT